MNTLPPSYATEILYPLFFKLAQNFWLKNKGSRILALLKHPTRTTHHPHLFYLLVKTTATAPPHPVEIAAPASSDAMAATTPSSSNAASLLLRLLQVISHSSCLGSNTSCLGIPSHGVTPRSGPDTHLATSVLNSPVASLPQLHQLLNHQASLALHHHPLLLLLHLDMPLPMLSIPRSLLPFNLRGNGSLQWHKINRLI